MPVSTAHVAFCDRWKQNEAHAPDPHSFLCSSPDRKRPPVILEDDITTEEERKLFAYYQETAKPADRDWWAAGRFHVDGRKWCLVLYRGRDAGPFQRSDTGPIARVGPHMTRVISLAEKFASFRAESELATLERIGCPALVIDVAGHVTGTNQHAEALLSGDLAIVRRRLVACDGSSNAKLQEIIAALVGLEPFEVARQGSVAILRDGLPWLLVEAMPITSFGSDLFTAGRIILLLNDLTRAPRPDTERLRIAFGLTPAEAKLAVHLSDGKGLEAAASALGISPATARSQLKAVFAKSGANRQAELVGMISNLRPAANH